MKRLYIFLMTLMLVLGLSVSAHATLIDMGDGTIYDDDLQLSWLQDANTNNGPITWSAANTWADNLNFAGFTDWRLPSALDQDGSGPCWGYNCTGSEMGHLYYTELGNLAYGDPAGGPQDWGLTNPGPFTNLQPDGYWSGTKLASDDFYAWFFGFDVGGQGYTEESYWNVYALAVRPGQRPTSVPEPATLLLLGSGLAGIAVWRKRLGRREG